MSLIHPKPRPPHPKTQTATARDRMAQSKATLVNALSPPDKILISLILFPAEWLEYPRRPKLARLPVIARPIYRLVAISSNCFVGFAASQ